MNKKKSIILIVLLAIILLAPLPSRVEKNLLVNRIENSSGESQEISVKIDGVYYKSFVLNDRFKGSFRVEGLDDVKDQVSLSFSKDKEANMNLKATNEPIYRILQKNKLKDFVVCISVSDGQGQEQWGNDYGFTITTLNSMNEVMEFIGL